MGISLIVDLWVTRSRYKSVTSQLFRCSIILLVNYFALRLFSWSNILLFDYFTGWLFRSSIISRHRFLLFKCEWTRSKCTRRIFECVWLAEAGRRQMWGLRQTDVIWSRLDLDLKLLVRNDHINQQPCNATTLGYTYRNFSFITVVV